MYSYITYFAFAIDVIFACEHYHDPVCQDVRPIDGDHFMNQFIAEIEGGEEMAYKVAQDTGFEYKKPVKTHDDHFFFTHPDVYCRHKKRHEGILKLLRDHEHVKVADQQFVWRPTLSELETYEDVVGLEEPLEVRTSHFHPDEVEYEGKSAYELIRPDDVFVEPEILPEYPPIHTLVDFEKLYEEKNREKEKRAQERRLQEELEKKLEAEKEAEAAAASSGINEKVADAKTTPQKPEPANNRILEGATAGNQENVEPKIEEKVSELVQEARRLEIENDATVESFDE